MRKIFSNVNYPLIIKTFLKGALIAELFFLLKILIELYIEKQQILKISLIIVIAYFSLIVTYVWSTDLRRRLCNIVKSIRLDLFVVLLSGGFFVFSFDGFGINIIKNNFMFLSPLQLSVFVALPIMVFISLIFKKCQDKVLQFIIKRPASLFLSDKEGKNKEDDAFGISISAEKFAERVYNQGSPESIVFGIDAPWGTGKSTFVNLCKEYWYDHYKNKVILYSFDPLRYEDTKNLMEKFIDGLIRTIRNHIFAPEAESLVWKYSKILKKSKMEFSFLGFKFELSPINDSLEDVFDGLEKTLINIDKKIIIIVDDLDRLNFSNIKEVLFVIKKAFTLPNISYVLCYDTDNITALEESKLDTEKVTEFLEKFVNVKTSLYLDNELLLKYFTEYKDKSVANNLLADPELLSKAVEGLRDIFKSKDFHYYLPFIGDARKIKRLINTILLLEIEKTDFENCDFNKQDLIHLLLILINYPNIFRKIYNSETQGRRGFFSVVSKYDDGYPKDSHSSSDDNYMNSSYYIDYLKNLTENQKFILNKVFQVEQRLVDSYGNTLQKNNITQEMYSSYACFNGSMLSSAGSNLEQYLNLLTKMSYPTPTKQYQFYVNHMNEILSYKTIDEVLSKNEFTFENYESIHQELWRVLINSSREGFKPEKSKEIINYAVNNLPQYSLLEMGGILVGFRHYLPFYIVKLLDQAGWQDEMGHNRNNTEKNTAEIARWIFGEGEHEGEAILDIIGQEDRGVLGLYDLLTFRLSCCEDRGADIFNLSRSLSKHGNPEAPTSGNVKEILIEEMREISQKIFQVFKQQYIDKNKNIFHEINALTLKNVCGKYFELINKKEQQGEIKDLDIKFLNLKSSIKSFIIYQLGSSIIELGIGCGYYDISGNQDKKEINAFMNDYLFKYCFNPKFEKDNYLIFLDYLLISFSLSIVHSGIRHTPNIMEFTKVLNKDRLADYWKTHNEIIKSKNFESIDKKLYTSNYIVSYQEHLQSVYEVLDRLINEGIDS